jgi:hypothetical protein
MTAPVSTNIANPGNFLRTSRNFPLEIQPLTVELNKAYVDIANQVNNRISGIFGTSPTITGESWFLNGQANRQNTLRQVYAITGAGSYPHGINTATLTQFSRIYGTATDGTKWYPLPYVDATAANNQIQVVITSTNTVVTAGSGSPPAITSGVVVLEWISQV